MPIQYQALKVEILTDPNGYGYGGRVNQGSDQGIADLLNLVRAGININRPDITPNEILEAIDTRDFIASPSAAQLAWFQSLMGLGVIRLTNDDGTPTRVQSNMLRLIGNTNGSVTRLGNVASRQGSRAEQLFGPGEMQKRGNPSPEYPDGFP